MALPNRHMTTLSPACSAPLHYHTLAGSFFLMIQDLDRLGMETGTSDGKVYHMHSLAYLQIGLPVW